MGSSLSKAELDSKLYTCNCILCLSSRKNALQPTACTPRLGQTLVSSPTLDRESTNTDKEPGTEEDVISTAGLVRGIPKELIIHSLDECRITASAAFDRDYEVDNGHKKAIWSEILRLYVGSFNEHADTRELVMTMAGQSSVCDSRVEEARLKRLYTVREEVLGRDRTQFNSEVGKKSIERWMRRCESEGCRGYESRSWKYA